MGFIKDVLKTFGFGIDPNPTPEEEAVALTKPEYDVIYLADQDGPFAVLPAMLAPKQTPGPELWDNPKYSSLFWIPGRGGKLQRVPCIPEQVIRYSEPSEEGEAEELEAELSKRYDLTVLSKEDFNHHYYFAIRHELLLRTLAPYPRLGEEDEPVE